MPVEKVSMSLDAELLAQARKRAGGPSGAIPPTAEAAGFSPHTPFR